MTIDIEFLDDMEDQVEKFVGQPVTPPDTPGKGDLSSQSSTQSTPTHSSSPTSSPSNMQSPYGIYSPMVSEITFKQWNGLVKNINVVHICLSRTTCTYNSVIIWVTSKQTCINWFS